MLKFKKKSEHFGIDKMMLNKYLLTMWKLGNEYGDKVTIDIYFQMED